jgi:hypothetical protein
MQSTKISKGGVGETTTVVNLSVGFFHVDKGVLVIYIELSAFFIKRRSPSRTRFPKEK